MASFEIIGKLKVKGSTQVVSDKFSKRDLVLVTEDQYPQFISLQLTQDKCALLDQYNVGDDMKVSFNLRGREWTAPDGVVKYFNSLEAWRLERSAAAQSAAGGNSNFSPSAQEEVISSGVANDDLPF
jgi:hypothetical protein